MDIEVLGLVAGGITSVAMMPQLIKVIKEKKCRRYFRCDASGLDYRIITLGLVRNLTKRSANYFIQ